MTAKAGSTMYRIRIACLLVVLMLASATTETHAADTAHTGPTPFLRVPKLATPPSMLPVRRFGGHWKRCAAVSGLRNALLPARGISPEALHVAPGFDASWHVGYDDEHVYLGAIIQLPEEGLRLHAETLTDHNSNIVKDDHLEFRLSLEDLAVAAQKPSLQVFLNSAGAVWAMVVEALPGQNLLIDRKRIQIEQVLTDDGHIPGTWWYVKMAIPFDVLDIESLDNRNGRMQVVYQAGFSYGSWGGGTWKKYDTMAEVVFDPAPPAIFQLNASYPHLLRRDGSLRLDGDGIANSGSPEEPLAVVLEVSNEAEGKTLYTKRQQAKVIGGETFSLPLRTRVPVGEGLNVMTIRAFCQGADGEETLLLRQILPFQTADAYTDTAAADWIEAHRASGKAEAIYDYVYSPYDHKLDAMVDTRIPLNLLSGEELERGKLMQAATECRVSVTNADGEAVASGTVTLVEKQGNVVLTFAPPLPEGRYTVAYQLRKDDQVVDEQERLLVRDVQPWEHTKLGLDAVVIPPWEPIHRSGEDSVALIGRTYTFGPSGLPTAMESQGSDVLGGAATLSGSVDGKAASLASAGTARIDLVPGHRFPAELTRHEWVDATSPVPGQDIELEPVDGYQARIHGHGTVGALPIAVEGTLDYDGLYTIALTLGGENPVQVDSLTLTIPISERATLYRFNRTYGFEGTGRIPDGEGVLYSSSDQPPIAQLHTSFVPIVFAGVYDRGLFWMAESDQGWSVADDSALVELVRKDGQLALRFNLVTAPVELRKPRRIEFALMATPSRPKPPTYRRALWEKTYSHDTAGWRYYGGGVNGFHLDTPADFEGLRKFYYEAEGPRSVASVYALQPAPEGAREVEWKVHTEAARNGGPLIVYGSTYGANAAMPGFATFGSGWIQSSDLSRTAQIQSRFRNWTNEGGTVLWDTDEELTPIVVCMDDSYEDAHLWHMVRLAKYSHINGFFNDIYVPYPTKAMQLASDVNGVAYRRPNGELQALAIPLRYHQRTRRFATAMWMMGRTPMILQSNNHNSTYGPTWFVEGRMYHASPTQNWIESGMTLDTFAAFTATTSGQARVTTRVRPILTDGKPTGVRENIVRVAMAFVLLHDLQADEWGISANGMSTFPQDILRVLKDEVDFLDPATTWVRYWEPEGRVAADDERVVVGGYAHADGEAALLIVLNQALEPIETTIQIGKSLLGREPTSIVEAESGRQLGTSATIALQLPATGTAYLLIK